MARVFVNYTYNKRNDQYTILESPYVFADLPIAICDTDMDYECPYVVLINGVNTVVEKSEWTSTRKEFVLAVDEHGNVKEANNGTKVWLPKETDVSKLKYINGELVLVEETETEEPKPNKSKGGKA